jgi:hypothetical protein
MLDSKSGKKLDSEKRWKKVSCKKAAEIKRAVALSAAL